MNFLDGLLQRLDTMSVDDIIQEIGGNLYKSGIGREEILKYPQFIQDIVFLIDMDTELNMQGDVLVNSTSQFVPNMITALQNIHADKEAVLLQTVLDTAHTMNLQEDKDEDEVDAIIEDLYHRMYFRTGFDIWSLLEAYVDKEKSTAKVL